MMMNDIFGLTAAFGAASSAGLLAALVEGPPRSAAEHASTLSLDPRAATLVLDVLVAYGVAERSGKAIVASAKLAEVANAPGGVSHTLAMWGHVPAFLRTGEPFMRMDSGREDAYSGVVAALGRMFTAPAAALARMLERAPRRVLDVGCGSGVWSLAIAQQFREARVTGLDLPAVLEPFRARAAALGLADRIDVLPGDVHELTIPRTFDFVVVANVLRIEIPERARAIVQRAAAALEPGGELLIVDALGSGTPEREQARSVYALHLGMRTDGGRVYSRDEIAGWIGDAGLRVQRNIDVDDGPGALGAMLAS